jgi:hypothetical protein
MMSVVVLPTSMKSASAKVRATKVALALQLAAATRYGRRRAAASERNRPSIP